MIFRIGENEIFLKDLYEHNFKKFLSKTTEFLNQILIPVLFCTIWLYICNRWINETRLSSAKIDSGNYRTNYE